MLPVSSALSGATQASLPPAHALAVSSCLLRKAMGVRNRELGLPFLSLLMIPCIRSSSLDWYSFYIFKSLMRFIPEYKLGEGRVEERITHIYSVPTHSRTALQYCMLLPQAEPWCSYVFGKWLHLLPLLELISIYLGFLSRNSMPWSLFLSLLFSLPPFFISHIYYQKLNFTLYNSPLLCTSSLTLYSPRAANTKG